jgi:hypothetical protein
MRESKNPLLPKYNSRCFFLSKDKTECKALRTISCDNCKFFKNKNLINEIAETLKYYHEPINKKMAIRERLRQEGVLI